MTQDYTTRTTTNIKKAKEWTAMACGSISSIYFKFHHGDRITDWMTPLEAYRYAQKINASNFYKVIKRKYS